ncbi:hypothetical protein LCGC14_1469910 [marine sediment metagenome]|uniref:ParB-like N-terminal domain-containing protein n=1 Tax=marine sediment metagenome TaxID=412755 RepID=A0A0F9LT36_9ZZZZ
MEIIKVLIKDLNPSEYNPRMMTEKQAKDLELSVKRFGFVEPIVVNSAPKRKNIIIGGHQRYHIAKKLGYKDIPVVFADIPDIGKEMELNLRLNKNNGQWDYDLLANFNEEMLLDTGFEKQQLDEIFNLNVQEDDFDADAEAEKIKKPESKAGEIYELGKHRLMCGDSTKKEDVEKLMNGQLANMVFTDPPYNVNYKSMSGHGYSEGKFKSDKMFNDNKSFDEYVEFLSLVFSNIYSLSNEKIAVFMWSGDRFMEAVLNAGRSNNFKVNQTAVWVKDRFTFSPGNVFHRVFEYCCIFFKDGRKPKLNRNFVKNRDNLINLKFDDFHDQLESWFNQRDNTKEYKHPTQKPVRLAEPALKACSEIGDIVIDLFGGSGSTLIACEQLGRRAYLMELDPKYCDVIRQRYDKFKAKTKSE